MACPHLLVGGAVAGPHQQGGTFQAAVTGRKAPPVCPFAGFRGKFSKKRPVSYSSGSSFDGRWSSVARVRGDFWA